MNAERFPLLFAILLVIAVACEGGPVSPVDGMSGDDLSDQTDQSDQETPDEETLRWVTGPGASGPLVHLLPYGIRYGDLTYTDEHPVLWETDQGWPVPDEKETELRYLLFGDSTFLLRDIEGDAPTGQVMNRAGAVQFPVYEDEAKRSVDMYALDIRAALGDFMMGLSVAPGEGYDACIAWCDADLMPGDAPCEEVCSYYLTSRVGRLGFFRNKRDEDCVAGGVEGFNHCLNNAFFTASLDVAADGAGGFDYALSMGDHIASKQDPAGRRALGMSLNAVEREQTLSVFPYGYFYACAGSPADGCPRRKLFVPSVTVDWGAGDTPEEVAAAARYCGEGMFDLDDEERIDFAPDGVTDNPQVLWRWHGRLAKATVVHGFDRDPGDRTAGPFVHFIGIGERCMDEAGCGATPYLGRTGGVYMARVPAYESAVEDREAYRYFAGIAGGAPLWRSYDEAVPLPGLTMYAMIPESIIFHRGRYWMTVQFSAANEESLDPDHILPGEQGFLVYTSLDAIHWEKQDKVVLDADGSDVRLFYAIFWLPSGLIHPDDDSIPYLFSVWKNNYAWDRETGYITDLHLNGFRSPLLGPPFTEYNVALGRYRIPEELK